MNALLFKITSKSRSLQLLNSPQRIIKTSSSLLFPQNTQTEVQTRNHYTFNLSKKLVRYRRSTRPKKSNDNSISLNYEQSQFAEKIGVTKSWNTWNTSNLLDSKSQPETSRDDILIRKFLLGTFHDLFASEVIIKRRLNTINIGFLVKFPRAGPAFNQKLYFLVGYSEELLSNLLKCVVKIQPQTVLNKNDLEFKKW